MNLPKKTFGAALGLALACAALFSGRPAQGDAGGPISGTQKIYGNIPPDQIEFLSTGDRIKSVAASRSMMNIWETLEHGEKVECLDCIPSVEPLLYDANPRTREIAAWWLRRRMFGVFGKGEVYERTVRTLESDADPKRRQYAAEALGELRARPGIKVCATALERDGDPSVRAAAASALARLGSDGTGALGRALGDPDARVKLAVLGAAGRVHSFAEGPAIARLVTDGDASVRRRAAELLGSLKVGAGVDGLLGVARSDPDPGVRGAACHALGELRDGRARPVLEEIARADADGMVRDQATMALRRL